MKQFTLNLMEDQRPIIYLGLKNDMVKVNAMLDTGALFPMWVTDEDILINLGSVLVKKDVEISGIGGKAKGNLYKMDSIEVGDLVYPGFYIVACKMDLPCHILLSATMFQNLIYEIDDKNHKLNISIPDDESIVRNLKIEDKNGRLHMLCCSATV